jgi:hypothetical protein
VDAVTRPDTLPTGDPLTERARQVLRANWRPEGYTVPNATVYPHQWLWDSCFHAVAWAALGEPDRARRELAAVFDAQGADGFVPHVRYWTVPDQHRQLWGRAGASTVTQPPMYGHALAELARRGVDVADEVVDRAWAGLTHLLTRRPRPGGGVGLVHPWESGCDHSPRWDAWCPGGFDEGRWFDVKGRLVDVTVRTREGTPVHNPAFTVASAGFDALVVFNCWELHAVRPEPAVEVLADEVAESLVDRWDASRRTWVDVVDADDERARPFVAGDAERFTTTSGGVRTLDALLGVLVDPRHEVADAVFAELRDPAAHGAPFGPTGVHRDEPSFEAGRYWRGAAWPQLTYLLWVAARARGRVDDADWLAGRLRLGAVASGFAEYWHPDDGTGRGAAPQSWTALAAVVDRPAG